MNLLDFVFLSCVDFWVCCSRFPLSVVKEALQQSQAHAMLTVPAECSGAEPAEHITC